MARSVSHVQAQFLRNAEMIKGFIYSLCPVVDQTEDVFQEVIRASRRRRAVEDGRDASLEVALEVSFVVHAIFSPIGLEASVPVIDSRRARRP